MFVHTARLQFDSKPDKPDPVYAAQAAGAARRRLG
jgi:hypothetical protein